MANILPLTIYPNDLLREISKEIDLDYIKTDEFKQLVLDMEKTMHDSKGVGLAAVQIGKLIRLTVINTDDGLLPLINPVIKKNAWGKEEGEEGCLSIPGIYGLVKRYKKITVETLDVNGEKIIFEADGFFARVIQHEIDHMNGVLFIDHTKKITKGEPEYRKLMQESKDDE